MDTNVSTDVVFVAAGVDGDERVEAEDATVDALVDTQSVEELSSVEEVDSKVSAEVAFVTAGVDGDERVEHVRREWTMLESKLEEAKVTFTPQVFENEVTAEFEEVAREVDEGVIEQIGSTDGGISVAEDVSVGNIWVDDDDFGNEGASATDEAVRLSTVIWTDEETVWDNELALEHSDKTGNTLLDDCICEDEDAAITGGTADWIELFDVDTTTLGDGICEDTDMTEGSAEVSRWFVEGTTILDDGISEEDAAITEGIANESGWFVEGTTVLDDGISEDDAATTADDSGCFTVVVDGTDGLMDDWKEVAVELRVCGTKEEVVDVTALAVIKALELEGLGVEDIAALCTANCAMDAEVELGAVWIELWDVEDVDGAIDWTVSEFCTVVVVVAMVVEVVWTVWGVAALFSCRRDAIWGEACCAAILAALSASFFNSSFLFLSL